MVRLGRFERPTPCLGGRCSIQLSYNRNLILFDYNAIVQENAIGIFILKGVSTSKVSYNEIFMAGFFCSAAKICLVVCGI